MRHAGERGFQLLQFIHARVSRLLIPLSMRELLCGMVQSIYRRGNAAGRKNTKGRRDNQRQRNQQYRYASISVDFFHKIRFWHGNNDEPIQPKFIR